MIEATKKSLIATAQHYYLPRVCKGITLTLWRWRRAGRCEAPRHRRCRCASARSGNKADARTPPRPDGLRSAGTLASLLAPYIPHRVCSSLAPCQLAWGPQQSANVIPLQTLTAAAGGGFQTAGQPDRSFSPEVQPRRD